MIMRLQGTVLDHALDWILLDVQGVGYMVSVPLSLVAQSPIGETVTVWTHEVVRDDSRQLFGFESRDGLELFWKLIGVNGVGPKVAQKILGTSTPEEVKRNVSQGSIDFLTRVPGVGKKTAQKIVLELQGTLVLDDAEGTAATSDDQELLDALTSLGYPLAEARKMADGLPVELTSIEEKIKAVLTTTV